MSGKRLARSFVFGTPWSISTASYDTYPSAPPVKGRSGMVAAGWYPSRISVRASRGSSQVRDSFFRPRVISTSWPQALKTSSGAVPRNE